MWWRKERTYRLQLLNADAFNSLTNLINLEWLATVDKSSTSCNKTSLEVLTFLQCTVFGKGNSLCEILLADGAFGNGLQSLNRLGGSTSDSTGRACELNSQKTSVRVGVVSCCGAGAWERS